MDLGDYVLLRRYNDSLYDIQETRKRVENRLRNTPESAKETFVPFGDLEEIEKTYTRAIEKALQEIPIWTEWMQGVKGVGPRLGSYIIGRTMIRFESVSPDDLDIYSPIQQGFAQKTEKGEYLIPMLRGIGAFRTISKYWAFWGLAVVDGHAQRREKGEKTGYSVQNRSAAWKLGKQFVMQGAAYRYEYDKYKARLTEARTPPEKCPQYAVNRVCKAQTDKGKKPSCKIHIHNMSMRYATKMFFKDLWINWRLLEGLEVSEPYVIAVLGHEPHRE